MNAPPTAAEYRAALEAVLEGLDIPHAKTTGDDEARSRILATRITHVKLMVDAVLTGAVGTPGWVIGYYREQLAKNPATGYHPSTAPIAYGQHGACAACGHRKGSHWEVAEPDGERRGCAYLGCTCTAYDGSIASDEAAAAPAGDDEAYGLAGPPPSVRAQAREDVRQMWRAAFGTDPS